MFFRKEKEESSESMDLMEIRRSVEERNLPDYARDIANKEIEKLEKTDPSTPEYAITLAYLDCLVNLPWNNFTDDNLDINRAKEILDRYHTGLNSVKERILDYLAVRTLYARQAFRILVVDDEKMARENLKYVLLKEGYEVEVAKSGNEAIEIMSRREFDLLLADLKMEVMDGIELMRRAKRIVPNIETIIFTGYATIDSAIEAMREGAINYLCKPINLNELKEFVRDVQKKKRFIKNLSGPILCFTGPPGTGKTSVGKAISKALGRKFTRLSLAGLRDEAELRGHRRTYVGAMPGRIIGELKRLGVANPLFMLDEIDKIGQDFKGDPVSVLLEILDPEQNSSFLDYYLDLPFDLSAVMFIVTGNSVDDLPDPLRDRLELIEFTGYSEAEKIQIAKNHLIPRQLSANALSNDPPSFSDEAIKKIIRNYTREAGVRNLEREISKICRKLARIRVESEKSQSIRVVDASEVENLLGPRKYQEGFRNLKARIGVTVGLVWTESGGDVIFVESEIMPGNQQLILTGSLGDVIKESAQIALSYIRSHAEALGISPDFYKGMDIHIHIPAGAIPKDGPSAGLSIAMALISLLTKREAKTGVAITGELSLIGRILPVAAVKEKILAAQRAGIETVVFPKQNLPDIENLEPHIVEGIEIITAEEIGEIIDRVLVDKGS